MPPDDLRGTRTPLRVGLVGCGAVSRLYHAPALALLEREGLVEVRVLTDPDPRALGELRAVFPAATASVEESAAIGAGLELAIVASPPRFHAEPTVRLLRAGTAVLCEKPMAASIEEAGAMIEAAERAGRPLAVGLVRRFLPATDFIHTVVREKLLGTLESFSCREGGSFRWPTRTPSFFERSNGGVLMDVGVHLLDLISWWLGSPERVEYADDAMGGVAANCRIHLRFGDGCAGEVRLSRDWAEPDRYDFRFEKGWLSWHIHEPAGVRLGVHGDRHRLDGALREGAVQRFEDAFVAQLRNLVAAVRGQEEPRVSGRDALESLRLIERCRAGRTLLPMPWLSETEAAAARRLGGAP